MNYILKSKRLGFRQWKESDLVPLKLMNANPQVMEFFPALMTSEQVESMYIRLHSHIEEHGFGFFATDVLDTQEFIGFIGIGFPRFELDFGKFLEIGWRTIESSWNKGYATEGAIRLLEYAFCKLELEEIYSMTPIQNIRSEHIMKKIGMHHDCFFDMPLLHPDSPLLKHTLYKIYKEDYIR